MSPSGPRSLPPGTGQPGAGLWVSHQKPDVYVQKILAGLPDTASVDQWASSCGGKSCHSSTRLPHMTGGLGHESDHEG